MTADRPETLWELCELTAQAIEENPQNYYQNDWARVMSKGPAIAGYEDSCGTAFCRAGWMCALSAKMDRTPEQWSRLSVRGTIRSWAEGLLAKAGIPSRAIRSLFDGTFSGNGMYWDPDNHNPQPGTPAYARAGADGMRKFMQEWESQLKGTKL